MRRIAKRALQERRGQDLIEYALMAGFLAVAAAAVMPGVSNYVLQIFCKVWGILINAGGGDVSIGVCSAI